MVARIACVLVFGMGLALSVTQASGVIAQYNEVLRWDGTGQPTPPTGSPANDWGTGWTALGSGSFQITLSANQTVWLGLGNAEVAANTKTISFSAYVDSGGYLNVGGLTSGYNPGGFTGQPQISQWSLTGLEPYVWTATIYPQPAWEFFPVQNVSGGNLQFTANLTSECTPEPVTLALLGAGVLALARRRH